MPEAPVDEHGDLRPCECDVRSAWKTPKVDLVAQTAPVQLAPQPKFGVRPRSSDVPHSPRCALVDGLRMLFHEGPSSQTTLVELAGGQASDHHEPHASNLEEPVAKASTGDR